MRYGEPMLHVAQDSPISCCSVRAEDRRPRKQLVIGIGEVVSKNEDDRQGVDFRKSYADAFDPPDGIDGILRLAGPEFENQEFTVSAAPCFDKFGDIRRVAFHERGKRRSGR